MKYFVISDVHSFYDQMMTALNSAGFDRNDPNHTLIVCGDSFDRGTQAAEMLDFLTSLERKVLIKGNHDDLLVKLCRREYPTAADEHNGTLSTVYQLGFHESHTKLHQFCALALRRFLPLYEEMLDYFETEHYIFVHSWIPLISERYGFKSFLEDWRNADEAHWETARWGNPYELAANGLKPDKTVVFGHWHTSWPRACWQQQPEFGFGADHSPYYGDGYIGIDAMTACSGQVNVLVLEDEPI